MSKIKGLLEEDMMRHPELYDGSADYEFWIQCRKEELLEKEEIGKYVKISIIHSKVCRPRVLNKDALRSKAGKGKC